MIEYYKTQSADRKFSLEFYPSIQGNFYPSDAVQYGGDFIVSYKNDAQPPKDTTLRILQLIFPSTPGMYNAGVHQWNIDSNPQNTTLEAILYGGNTERDVTFTAVKMPQPVKNYTSGGNAASLADIPREIMPFPSGDGFLEQDLNVAFAQYVCELSGDKVVKIYDKGIVWGYRFFQDAQEKNKRQFNLTYRLLKDSFLTKTNEHLNAIEGRVGKKTTLNKELSTIIY
ncbi:hypothetical protein [Niabella drilacis]|uniref:Uncharacterized protein n=1 Tax=Niabella drilacis (strain DSM 25811 / CCM 8410 / CCUG 62505 / LMG 26954 / E90) TaxID=1285928 RepID=A0A1G6SXG3_NIADE|nr:hypothetical protein [Niabella drilacis]SDD21479.1 hypothetical protein SAMN04487894_1078 [Niabella drilacis]